ncbi:fibronectin type III domain-containing protein [Nocardioides sp. B-3]|uniref:fibronectin type III domain-containing protein n=1 Tax=Nocardioides sp. B-3 TaxID=2895565 RepID=UPI0021523E8A|nr:fibronectin type III domain-containing protein [Nocardioides sp. B-3]UUZ57863.1 fibronectin type III domain-containing protein [Nocardioides sp. B-3]
MLRVAADEDASRGGEATLSITAEGSEPADVRFRPESASPPTMLAIRGEELEAGKSRDLDPARYLVSDLAAPSPRVLSADLISGSGVTANPDGQSGVTLRAGPDAKGTVVFRVVMSDIDDSSAGPARRAEGRLEVEVAGLPGEPSEPYDYTNVEKGAIRLGWFAPKDDGGSPITGYVLREERSGDTRKCRTTSCDFTGLKESKDYNFRVAAVNKVGQGPWSDLSRTAYADTRPARVSNVRMISRGDHTITIGWSKPESATPIKQYRISWLGQPAVPVAGTQLQLPVSSLDNNQKYIFSVEAENSVGWSPRRDSIPLQPLGTPAPPVGLTVVDRQSGVDNTDVAATRTATLPEGPAPTLYTLLYSANAGPVAPVPGCSRIQATTCTHSGVAYDGVNYSYVVQAHNLKNTSADSAPVTFEAVGKPANWGAITVVPTGVDGEARGHRHRTRVAGRRRPCRHPRRRRSRPGEQRGPGAGHQRAREDGWQRHGLSRRDADVQRVRRQGRLQHLGAEGRPDLRSIAARTHC